MRRFVRHLMFRIIDVTTLMPDWKWVGRTGPSAGMSRGRARTDVSNDCPSRDRLTAGSSPAIVAFGTAAGAAPAG